MKNLLIVACAAVVLLAGCVTGTSRQETTPNQRASEVLQRLDPSAGDKPVRLRAVLMGSDAGTTRWGDGLTPLGAIDTLPEARREGCPGHVPALATRGVTNPS